MGRIKLTNPDFFNSVSPKDGHLYCGHNQEWYRNWFKRLAGCGPTTAANILLYQALAGLLPKGDAGFDFPLGREGSRERMNLMWHFVTPSRMGGVNSTKMFCEGITAFAESVGLGSHAEALDVAKCRTAAKSISEGRQSMSRATESAAAGQPKVEPGKYVYKNEGTGTEFTIVAGQQSVVSAAEFIAEGLKNDRPVAFLNLDNGSEKQLDRWHWVTVVGIEFPEAEDRVLIEVLDNCRFIKVDLRRWMETTSKGGGFVRFYFGALQG